VPRSPAKNKDIRDARRADILRAATRLFARRGLGRPRGDGCAEAAGPSLGLVYHYFPSKEAVYEAILTEKREEAWSRITEVGERVGPRAAVEQLVVGALADAAERPEVTLLVAQALTNETIPERVRVSVRRGAREGFDRTVALLEAGQRAGDVDDSVPAAELAAALFSVLRGIFLTTALMGRGKRTIPVPAAATILRVLDCRSPVAKTPSQATTAWGSTTQTATTKPAGSKKPRARSAA